ncbi:tripartite tricarboxylate transporter TctB family protein [Ureibacillus sp. GCM10028918]|uniref:tripartite tricarboxylate transporter TctB family protein n=1 Tax=Ureibacillus sp. GCM10028918 TaxID=3273429 RepID=UPI00361228F6
MKNLNIYVALLLLIISGIIYWQSLSLPYYSAYGPGPGFLPRWTSGIIIILLIICFIQSIHKDFISIVDAMPKGEGLINVLVSFVAVIVFIIIIPYVGFNVSSVIMLTLLFSRGFKLYKAVGLSFVVTFIVFFIFGTLLGVPLPVNEYGW